MKITIAMSDTAIAKELFERLESYRKSRRISQETLAENLGISRPTYARLQNGTCSFVTFIGILREMNLLEGLNVLIPNLPSAPLTCLKRRKGGVGLWLAPQFLIVIQSRTELVPCWLSGKKKGLSVIAESCEVLFDGILVGYLAHRNIKLHSFTRLLLSR
ncbi:helix-turn-helix domain-containing protein [Serratia fonticola]|uniref:helix-turn-helix domain-containing protein n=1 Tax=Serratia fonticola TaxID=47917 RepID=UPI001F266620|nr:helix-turn-helix transcriptional regulator [Serratia fonticola]